jgi:hypothetical protein
MELKRLILFMQPSRGDKQGAIARPIQALLFPLRHPWLVQPSPCVLARSYGLFDEITYLVEKAPGLTPRGRTFSRIALAQWCATRSGSAVS